MKRGIAHNMWLKTGLSERGKRSLDRIMDLHTVIGWHNWWEHSGVGRNNDTVPYWNYSIDKQTEFANKEVPVEIYVQ